MPTHATHSPRGAAVPGAVVVTDADRHGGGPTSFPETATADRTSRQVARETDGPAHPRHPVSRSFPRACEPPHGTFPGRPPHGAAGGLSAEMTTVRFIRVFVFRMSQTEFAALLGTSQGRVSTWEADGRFPSMVVMDLVRMHGRRLCAERGDAWSDSWFFEVPADAAPWPAAAE